jgi:hypothetical protein
MCIAASKKLCTMRCGLQACSDCGHVGQALLNGSSAPLHTLRRLHQQSKVHTSRQVSAASTSGKQPRCALTELYRYLLLINVLLVSTGKVHAQNTMCNRRTDVAPCTQHVTTLRTHVPELP